jgi:uncharacterized membrane protein (UPF0136 family)
MNWLQIVLAAYGVINIAGGVFGFLMVGSFVSLAAGAGAGVILLALTAWTFRNPAMGYRLAAVVSLALAAFWGSRLAAVLAEGDSPMVPGMNLALSVFVFFALVAGHLCAVRKGRQAG